MDGIHRRQRAVYHAAVNTTIADNSYFMQVLLKLEKEQLQELDFTTGHARKT